jgi:hypothetical protein
MGVIKINPFSAAPAGSTNSLISLSLALFINHFSLTRDYNSQQLLHQHRRALRQLPSISPFIMLHS